MTKPTQAQIEAARIAVVEYFEECGGFTFADDKGACWGPSTIYPHLIAEAALTAAQVGGQAMKSFIEDTPYSEPNDGWSPTELEVLEEHQAMLQAHAETKAATIERCAQVVEKWMSRGVWELEKIATAIRKLKDET